MSRSVVAGLVGFGVLVAGCGEPVGTPSASASPAIGVPSASLTTTAERVIEDPPCPPARSAADLAGVRAVDTAPRCAEGWAAVTAGAGRVRVVLRRRGFEYVPVDVSPRTRPCTAALAGLPTVLRAVAGCGG